MKIETRLGDQKRRILKTDIALKKRVEPTEVTRKNDCKDMWTMVEFVKNQGKVIIIIM